MAQVTGRVIPIGPPLRAPISGRPCVYYQVMGRNHVWPWHDRRGYPESDVGFWIEDGGGQVWIMVPASPVSTGPEETAAVQCSITGDGFHKTIYAGESPETDRFLDPVGSPFEPDAYLNVEERIVVAGDTLEIVGEVFEEITLQGESLNYRSPPTRTILKARSLRSIRA
ncbi:MAG TPA: hypothetical protein VFH73_01100 [Polyangia bacterium]|nr:hypothetical protein [Polyangia bacterium]